MANYGKYYIAARLLLEKQYLETNAGRNRIVKRSELEDFLAEHDMPVEKKTLYADFAALGDICGLQLEYDPHQKGYRLLNPPFEPYELRLLVDSVQSSRFITQGKAREITAKIKKLAGKDMIIFNRAGRNTLCCLGYDKSFPCRFYRCIQLFI